MMVVLDWHIINRNSALRMRGPGLAVHLIRDHGFFEGPGVPDRLDPLALVRLLEVPHSANAPAVSD